jgi:hypothetical protein
VTPARTLHLTNPLARGPDVSKAQGLLASHGYLPKSGVDGVFGPQTADACERAKYALGYPQELVVPTCGAVLIGYLSGGPMPADYLKRAAERKADQHTAAAIRSRIVDYCKWGIKNEPAIHYAQTRPMENLLQPTRLQWLPRSADCSEFATDACAWAGAPDPNGFGYSGLGYTGTMLSHLPHITAAMVQPGDLCVYGPFPGHHVIVAMEAGPDPICCSHGQESGPRAIRASDEAKYQPSPATWLRSVPA